MSIALWCVLLAAMLPVISTGIAKFGGADTIRSIDNNHPRDWANGLTGWRRRAYAAHENAFEAFPFFAAAVIVAEMLETGGTVVNILAMIFIAARLGYLACYITDRSTLRSALWFVAFACCVAIFVRAAF